MDLTAGVSQLPQASAAAALDVAPPAAPDEDGSVPKAGDPAQPLTRRQRQRIRRKLGHGNKEKQGTDPAASSERSGESTRKDCKHLPPELQDLVPAWREAVWQILRSEFEMQQVYWNSPMHTQDPVAPGEDTPEKAIQLALEAAFELCSAEQPGALKHLESAYEINQNA